jgi:hypothetical protein
VSKVFYGLLIAVSVTLAHSQIAGAAGLRGINVDFSDHHGLPTASYGAASAQPGTWNEVGTGVNALVDTDGIPSGVSLTLVAANGSGFVGSTATSDDQRLLQDYFFGSSGDTWIVELNGLEAGEYLVYLYAPAHSGVSTGEMTVDGAPVGSLPGDVDANLIEGTSYTSAPATVTDGTLVISGVVDAYGGLAGLQIVPLVTAALNVDFGRYHGPPANSYGAASGQTGTWNEVGAGVSPLVDTSGALAGVSLALTTGSAAGNTGVTASDDAERLLFDHFFSSVGATWTVDVRGLESGSYRVYLYAPSHSAVSTGELTVNGTPVASLPGDIGANLIEGVSYASVLAELTDGTLALSGVVDVYGGLAGLQVVPLPEPGRAALFATGIGVLGVLARRRGHRASRR